MNEEQLLDHPLIGYNEFENAGLGKRFLNYVIDRICFYIFIFIFSAILIVLGIIRIDVLSNINSAVDMLVTMLIYAIYMGSMEAILKGKSIGKYITKTRAVNTDYSPISARTAFLRGVSRIVPFEPFSALGAYCNPWHDSWTDTVVIDESKPVFNNVV